MTFLPKITSKCVFFGIISLNCAVLLHLTMLCPYFHDIRPFSKTTFRKTLGSNGSHYDEWSQLPPMSGIRFCYNAHFLLFCLFILMFKRRLLIIYTLWKPQTKFLNANILHINCNLIDIFSHFSHQKHNLFL